MRFVCVARGLIQGLPDDGFQVEQIKYTKQINHVTDARGTNLDCTFLFFFLPFTIKKMQQDARAFTVPCSCETTSAKRSAVNPTISTDAMRLGRQRRLLMSER